MNGLYGTGFTMSFDFHRVSKPCFALTAHLSTCTMVTLSFTQSHVFLEYVALDEYLAYLYTTLQKQKEGYRAAVSSPSNINLSTNTPVP